MHVIIGEKIRSLRQRDGRRQEDLATALGVSAQAVSRWENNSAYPDMELVPAITNYFHVTIDELFGYNGDREARLAEIRAEAERVIGGGDGDVAEGVGMLRAAAEEFPSEAEIRMNLGFALIMLGWQKHGARMYTKDGSDYAYEDIGYNSENPYWREASQALERALELGLSGESREAAILCLVRNYAKMGMNEEAKALAGRQSSIIAGRECLMALIGSEEEHARYLGEAIIELMRQLRNVTENAVATKMSMTKDKGIDIFMALIRLFEAIFDDGRCGIAHTHLRDLYMYCTIYEIRLGRRSEAREHCLAAWRHDREYRAIRGTGEYHYTAPLVAEVTFPSANFPPSPDNLWEGWQSILPDDFVEELKSDPDFAGCFV